MHKVILTFATAITMIGCSAEKEQSTTQYVETKSIKVETSIAKSNQKIDHLNYTGAIIPSSTTPLSFQLPGLVQNIYVSEGDVVKKGQVLASINKKSFQSTSDMATASQKQAQDAYERLKQVHDKGSLPEIQWQEMNANLAKANAAAEIAQQNLNNCNITAPINGVIGTRDVEIGSTATPGISVFKLVTIQKLYVRIAVPETEIRKIEKGQTAQITIAAVSTESFTAVIKNIGVIANPFSKTYEVKLVMDNPKMIIKPGMACDIDLETTSITSAISVPYHSVIQDEKNKNYVYTVNKSNNTVTKQYVEIGLFSNNELIVTKGLSEGDLVVVVGQQKLHDQSTVIIN